MIFLLSASFTSRQLPTLKKGPIKFIKGGLTSILKKIRRVKNNSWWVGGCMEIYAMEPSN